jgi:ligand-binding sensor domain-containing protein
VVRSCFLAFLCLLFLAAGTARGVEIDAFFLGLDIRDDLPQDTVHAVLRDSRGFLWVATQGGLARWDGYRMRVFRRDPASVNSLPGNDIVALAEGRDGRIWVGTLYAGVAAIAPESGYIERFGRARGLASDRITTMAVAPDGAIWLGHPGSGLSRIDPASDSASTYASGLGVSGLTAVEDGLWVAGPGGLGFMPWDADQPEPVSLDPAPSPGEHLGMYAVDATPGWPVAVAASTGLWLQNPDTGVFHQRVLRKPGEGGVGLTDVLRVPDGTLWVSTDSGLWRVSADGEQAEPVTAASERSRLPDYPLQTLHYDDQGLLWIGTDNAGLWRMIRPPDGIHLRQLRYQEQSPLVWAAEAHDGLLWLGTVEHGLLAFGDDDEPEAAYLLDAETDVGDSIWGLASGKSGLWVGTRPVALYRVQDGRLEEHPKVMASVDHVRADAILDLMEDSDGHVWIATNGDGLHRYDPASGEIRAWRAEGIEEHGLGDDRLRRIHQDPEGRLWIGTDGSGLYMRPPGASRFRHIPAGEEGLPGGMIETIRHDSQGNIWVGTYDGGVARLNPWGGIRRITEAEGLPSDSVAGLELDAQDRVWVMTDLGLARIDPDGFVQRFGQAQGVLPFLVHVGSHARGPGNELIFAGEEGLLTVDPVALSSDAVAIEPRVTDVRVMGEPVWAGRTLYQPLTAWQERGLQLSHDQPALSLDYAVADLTDPGHHRYRHRLKGLESDWHYTSGARASATYTNLGSGPLSLRAGSPEQGRGMAWGRHPCPSTSPTPVDESAGPSGLWPDLYARPGGQLPIVAPT